MKKHLHPNLRQNNKLLHIHTAWKAYFAQGPSGSEKFLCYSNHSQRGQRRLLSALLSSSDIPPVFADFPDPFLTTMELNKMQIRHGCIRNTWNIYRDSWPTRTPLCATWNHTLPTDKWTSSTNSTRKSHSISWRVWTRKSFLVSPLPTCTEKTIHKQPRATKSWFCSDLIKIP